MLNSKSKAFILLPKSNRFCYHHYTVTKPLDQLISYNSKMIVRMLQTSTLTNIYGAPNCTDPNLSLTIRHINLKENQEFSRGGGRKLKWHKIEVFP